VLPPSPTPPDNAAVLPIAERAPDPLQPVPPPTPTAPGTWKERLLSSLAPPPRSPDAVLPPSFATLDRVAAADARLHDDKNEERLVVDYGPFFRRGLEALRATWHPDEVLQRQQRDEVLRCARELRTTLAVAVIDREGDVIDVELKRPSGCPMLDAEALAAFRRVARFPHPPDGLFVDGVGAPADTARLPVRFIVSFDGTVRLDWR
jgi:TonB family protein